MKLTELPQSTIYRIYCGRDIPNERNKANGGLVWHQDFHEFLVKYVTPYIKGFTTYEAVGYWEGKPERSFVIEVLGNDWDVSITQIAEDYRREFKQYAVLITRQDSQGIKSYLVESETEVKVA